MDGMTNAYQRPVRASGTPWWVAATWVAGVSLVALVAVWKLMPAAPSTASVVQDARIALAGGGTPAAIANRMAAALPALASAIPAILAAVLVAALAALGGLFLGRGRAQPDPVPDARSVAAPAPPDPGSQRLRVCSQQRSVLVRRLAELVPQLPESLAWQAANALDEAGIQVYIPDGEVFDPGAHHAVGTEPVVARGTENTVARTIRPGYRDGQQILIYPKVVVFADAPERETR